MSFGSLYLNLCLNLAAAYLVTTTFVTPDASRFTPDA
jgi:hypothetical protein